MTDLPDPAARPFDVVVYGATGFTGRLVAEHLVKAHGQDRDLAWAMAGRSETKLAEVRDEVGAPADLPTIVANADDHASLREMCFQTRVVISTVGPYQLYGEPLIAACAETGTDYVDLCGEPAWMAAMIEKYDAAAKASGARIVFSCGFDSIPFDLGVWFLQTHAKERFGAPCPQVKGRVRRMKGTFSGGTAASMIATMKAAVADPGLRKTLADPFALTPGFSGPRQPSGGRAVYDEAAGAWAAPFIMAPINTKNVHRSNALLGHAYGEDFVYDEMLLTGDGPKGEKRAKATERGGKLQNMALAFAPSRALIAQFFLPKPGEGPTRPERETGYYDILFIGQAPDGKELRAAVKGDMDPGYGSTSKMIAESALCLAKTVGRDATPGGIWTAAAAMDGALLARLEANAGLSFALEEPQPPQAD
ncbi:MAG: saccharopine dehydrogenase NADP-binding domain-containing protein [Maricaulaceae bacterium]|jgi:short subunit dehydrogenase-like uncharacterized protein